MDRVVEDRPELASSVPSLFASRSLSARAFERIEARQPLAALTLAQSRVRHEPMEPDSTAALGAARLLSGDQQGAYDAFRVAAQFGWRTVPTQLYWLQQATALKDYKSAAERFDALARQSPSWLRERPLIDPLERDPRGRAELVARLAERPGWLENYASDMTDLPRDVVELRYQVLMGLSAKGIQVGCHTIAPATSQLAQLGSMVDAAQLWRAHCPSATGKGAINDGSFAAVTADPALAPFAWNLSVSGDVDIAFEPADHGQKLVITSTAAFDRPVASQLLAATPGPYILRWQATDQNARPSDRILAALSCGPTEPVKLSAATLAPDGRWTLPLSIAPACAGEWLRFSIAAGSGSVSLSDVTLEPRR
ncbi:hypothetical protein [Novosphingobium lentum]|uniref:hypothetical protein n=1 Tax=Novosphingobium lentum TaxID=145287 RepID=UPI0012ED82FC|nr:hypothetical protein [Novosphingobium lentum]